MYGWLGGWLGGSRNVLVEATLDFLDLDDLARFAGSRNDQDLKHLRFTSTARMP